jgi:predicted lipoprotein DUF2380
VTADWSPTPVPVPYADFHDPQSLNLYGYVRNLPTSKVDTDGHECQWCQKLWNKVTGNGWKTDAEVEQDEIKRERDYLIKQKAEIDGKQKDYTKATDKEVKEDFQKIVDAFDKGKIQKLEAPQISRGSGPIEDHHELPRQFRDKFERAGLDIEKYTKEVPRDAHRLKPGGIHARGSEGWNQEWGRFFEKFPNATKQQILKQLDKMRSDFGLK